MQIFTTSLIIKSKNVTFLSMKNLKDVKDDDIILTSGTNRDEIMLKNLFNLSLFPIVFLVRKDDKEVNDFTKRVSLGIYDIKLDEISIENLKEIAELILNVQKNMKYIEYEKLLEEMKLLSAFYMLYISEKKSKYNFRRESVSTKDKIFIQECNTKKTSLCFMILKRDDYIKIFEIKGDFTKDKLNEKADKNFNKLFRGESIDENIVDITDDYRDGYLLVGKKDGKFKPINPIGNDEKSLKTDGDYEEILVYKLQSKKANEHSIALMRDSLKILQKLLSNDILGKNYSNLFYFLNVNYSFKKLYQEAKEDIQVEFLIKLLEKFEKDQTEHQNSTLTQFEFITIFLKYDNLDNLNDLAIITIFNHINSGVGVTQIINKGYEKFIENFKNYKKDVLEAENIIIKSCDVDEDFRMMYEELSDNHKVSDIKYIDTILTYLGDEHPLSKKIANLQKQLRFLFPKPLTPVDEDKNTLSSLYQRDKSIYSQLEDEENLRFLYIIFFTLLNMKNRESLKIKKIIKLIVKSIYEIEYDLNGDDYIDEDKCFLLYMHESSIQKTHEFAGWLDEYFNDVDDKFDDIEKIDEYLKKNFCNYECEKKDKNFTIKFKTCDIESFETTDGNFRQIISRIKQDQKIFYLFIECLGKNADDVIQKIIKNGINEKLCCEGKKGEISSDFLKIIKTGSKDCDKYIKMFIDSFRELWTK